MIRVGAVECGAGEGGPEAPIHGLEHLVWTADKGVFLADGQRPVADLAAALAPVREAARAAAVGLPAAAALQAALYLERLAGQS